MPLTNQQIVSVFRAVAMNDRTHYEHHEARPRDGRVPGEDGASGTIWLTPRELALAALRAMGEETDTLYWPFRKLS